MTLLLACLVLVAGFALGGWWFTAGVVVAIVLVTTYIIQTRNR